MHNEITVSKWGDCSDSAGHSDSGSYQRRRFTRHGTLFVDEMGRDGQQYPADEFGRIDLFSRFLAELLADVLSAQSVFLTPYLQPSYARGT